jgi:hypothetical protein
LRKKKSTVDDLEIKENDLYVSIPIPPEIKLPQISSTSPLPIGKADFLIKDYEKLLTDI